MPFELIPLPHFIKEVKTLAKKYTSFKADLEAMGQELLANPTTGEPLGKDCYKVRMTIASKGKGKSGGGQNDHLLKNCAGTHLPVNHL